MKSLIEKLNDPRQMRLSQTQKEVFVIILTSPTGKVAHDRLKNLSLLMATATLASHGFLEVKNYSVSLTPLGEEMARLSNLTDDSGQLTQDAEQIIQPKQEGFKIISKMTIG